MRVQRGRMYKVAVPCARAVIPAKNWASSTVPVLLDVSHDCCVTVIVKLVRTSLKAESTATDENYSVNFAIL